MRVVSPMLIDGTGRVTKGGSICMDQLYKNGWSPSCTVETIIRGFANTVGHEGSREGPGRVDPRRLSKFYRYDDYIFSYDQTAGFHTWKASNG
jgi:ubiquitin-protein ligase